MTVIGDPLVKTEDAEKKKVFFAHISPASALHLSAHRGATQAAVRRCAEFWQDWGLGLYRQSTTNVSMLRSDERCDFVRARFFSAHPYGIQVRRLRLFKPLSVILHYSRASVLLQIHRAEIRVLVFRRRKRSSRCGSKNPAACESDKTTVPAQNT